MGAVIQCDIEECAAEYRSNPISIEHDAKTAGWTVARKAHTTQTYHGIHFCPIHKPIDFVELFSGQ